MSEPTSERTNKFYSCAIELTLDLLSGKGKPALLRHLARGVTGAGELNRAMPLSGPRMMNLLLRELERDGLVDRSVQSEVPLRVEYTLREEGRRLAEMLEAMSRFGESYATQHQIELLSDEDPGEELRSRSAS